MRTTIAVVLGAISLTSAFVFADKPDVAKSANDEVSTLFFGHDDRVPVNDTTQSPWDAVGWNDHGETCLMNTLPALSGSV